MDKPKVSIQFWSALAMLIGGYGLAVAGFIVPPTGEISESVLWIFTMSHLCGLDIWREYLLWAQGAPNGG